ncbi:MAG: type 1 glutamine amidotransferase [Alkalispirochaeta sp.]
MRIDVLQHVPFEGPAEIAHVLEEWGHVIHVTHLYAGDPLPAADHIGALVAMGGPMSVNDTDDVPWLAPEIALIREVIRLDTPVLGVCLGAQLIAAALGARVYPGEQREIGWYPVTTTSDAADSRLTADWPARATVLHWHGDTFDLPPEARLLATSRAYRHQAFHVRERVVGLQFHLEMGPEHVDQIVQNSRDELMPGPYVQSEEAILAGAGESVVLSRMLRGVLRGWIGPAEREERAGSPGGSNE